MKLYKFRPLGTYNDYRRAKRIITEGKFWCSRFWDLNDPMEGVFTIIASKAKISKIFGIKREYLICSFSSNKALKKLFLWGYYANGFKGVAIEIEVKDDMLSKIEPPKIAEVKYDSKRRFSNRFVGDIDAEEIADIVLTRKLKCWNFEEEFRFLIKDSENEQEIGEITKVIFGNPYERLGNTPEILNHSEKLIEYKKYREELKIVCQNKGIKTDDFFV